MRFNQSPPIWPICILQPTTWANLLVILSCSLFVLFSLSCYYALLFYGVYNVLDNCYGICLLWRHLVRFLFQMRAPLLQKWSHLRNIRTIEKDILEVDNIKCRISNTSGRNWYIFALTSESLRSAADRWCNSNFAISMYHNWL